MSKYIRIIPRLDIKGPNLVKCVHLEGLRVLGKPEDFARRYYHDGADELIYIDLVASLYGRNNLHEIVSRTAKTISIPLTVGGGIRTVDDIRQLLRSGADKVAINTALFHTPELLSQGAKIFGSQCMVVYIEAKKTADGRYVCMHTNARERTETDVFAWADRAVELGAGEVLLTSVDNEGTGKGFDLELTRRVAASVPVPVIAAGGAGGAGHVLDVIREGRADAVCAASIFHYHDLERLRSSERFDDEGNTAFLELDRGDAVSFLRDRITPTGVVAVKSRLAAAGIDTRTCASFGEA